MSQPPQSTLSNAIVNPPDLVRLASAFCEAQAVHTAVELGLFPMLQRSPATEPQLLERLGLASRGTRDWLNLLVAIGLLFKRDGRYHLTMAAEVHLLPHQPGYVGAYFAHTNRTYPAWACCATFGVRMKASLLVSMIGVE